MERISQHAEWLSMVEVSGPFLAISVLESVFPQGLEKVETPKRKLLRGAYDEWHDAVVESDPLVDQLHQEWIRLVLTKSLEYDDTVLIPNKDLGEPFSYSSQEHVGTFSPDFVVRGDNDKKPCLFVSIQAPGTDLEKVKVGDGWPASLLERMILLCRKSDVRLGLITNGERWMLVNAPVGETSSHASWYARLWSQEPITFKAFQTLFGVRRCFGPAEETLDALLEESLKHQEEVTDTLGEQVRRAVEVLVQCLDKADEGRNRELLHDVKPSELYEAGLTVMMRLVFVLCAEERELLLLGDPVYDQCYAISTLRSQLTEEADRHGDEVLECRYDAWSRLLAVFRGVYGGIEHENLSMPALGGSLFDPDRFPFLEGRVKGTHWRECNAIPLPIDNRTVLLLLNALQILKQKSGALLLSYKALDVEQIGHVYEGLLEHTVERLPQVTLGLEGSKKAKNPNLPLSEMESAKLDGHETLVELIKDATLRSVSAITKALEKKVDEAVFGKVLAVCGGNTELANRIRPFAHLLRADAWGDFIVYKANAFAVTLGADRRETGTHYTPKSLTESIVETTLEPVVYIGPAEGKPKEEWKLKSSAELLDLKICDPAMGSGAFLVQVCRWLSERVVEAWGNEEAQGKAITVDGEVKDSLGGLDPMPISLDDRLIIAKRLIAEKCLYGVDLNPLAVELAKLSIWLVTLAKGRPFGFLDHNLRHGDSLLGIHRLDQLMEFSMNPTGTGNKPLFAQNIETAIDEVIEIRKSLRQTPIRDIRDVEVMAKLDKQARQKLESIELVADAMVGETLASGGNVNILKEALASLSAYVGEFLNGNTEIGNSIKSKSQKNLSIDLSVGKLPRNPLHWPLEFPEVFENNGFDAIVGNPPFMGGRKISSNLGAAYQVCIKRLVFLGAKGSLNLVLYFFMIAILLLKKNGTQGLISTDSITESDSREVGLVGVLKNATLFNAISSQPWPGKAGVYISLLHLFKGQWNGEFLLDGNKVEAISSMLEPGIDLPEPVKLTSNIGFCSDGVKVQGIGFVLNETEAKSIIEEDSNNKVITRYIVGDDINTDVEQLSARWVINFWNSDEDYCQKFIKPWKILLERVKPYRDGLTRQVHESCFWKFWDRREDFFNKVRNKGSVFVSSKLSKHFCVVFGNPEFIYSEKAKVFDFATYTAFSVLQSSFHSSWALAWGSTTGETPAYVGSRCFDTFAFPECLLSEDRKSCFSDGVLELTETVGREYYKHRHLIMQSNQEGLTATYNRFNDPEESSGDIQKLRDLHVEMDNAVAVAYSWDDLGLGHGFYETKQGLRFTICEKARREVLQRLIELNHERYAEEVNWGLHNKKTKKKVKKKAKKQQGKTLF